MECLALAVASSALTFIMTKIVRRFSQARGLMGVDVHKPYKPLVPEACGAAIMMASSALILALALLKPRLAREVAAFTLATVFVGMTGLLDDIRILDAKTKTFLTVMGAIPLVVLDAYTPRPLLPFIGKTRLTILYLLMLPLAIAVPANAVNMMDTYNGVMPATMSLVFTALTFSSIAAYEYGLSSPFAAYASSVMAGSLLGYYVLNRYPSRVFSGDVGSLYVGAAFGAIAVIGRVEFPAMTALLPFIMNSFHSLWSIGGLRERREIKVRPVIVEEGLLRACPDSRAPITLAHLFLLREPLTENELITCYILAASTSSILSVVTTLLTFP